MLLFRRGVEFGLDLAVGCGWFLKGALKLLVGFFLDGLRVLKLLDELHFDALHVQNFVLFLLADVVLELSLFLLVALSHVNLTAVLLFHLHLGETLLLVHDLVLHLVLSLYLELVVADLLRVLCALDFSLFGLLSLRKVNGFLYLALLLSSLLLNHVVLIALVSLDLKLLLHLALFLLTETQINLLDACLHA